jgi:hypothetical protein
MSPSRLRLNRLTHRLARPGIPRGAGLLGLASLVALAAAGCKGEEAFYPRDAATFAMLGSGGNTGKGGASGGSVGTGGGGASGMAGNGAAGQGGGGGQPTGHFGDFCQSDGECQQGTCQSHFCCATGTDCSGTCQTCDSTNGTTCVPVPGQLGDPRGDCKSLATSKDICGIEGTACNGAGACALWPAGTPCSIAPTCTSIAASNDSVISSGICDAQGTGKCQPQTTSCNNFLCEQPDAGATGCLTSCASDTDCVKDGFCASGNSRAGYCVGPVPNLAGNGDAEYGPPPQGMSPFGWSVVQDVSSSMVSASTTSHSGTYSIEETGRSHNYDGPGYYIPTGQGKYTVSFWAMQNQLPAGNADAGATDLPSGLLQLAILCNAQTMPTYLQDLPASPLPKGIWVNFSYTFDTTVGVPPSCFPDGMGNKTVPGDVKNAVVFLQDSTNSDPTLPGGSYPNFYIDDLVVTVPDAPTHNLDGNPTFESGNIDGWATTGTGATITVNTTGMYAHNPGTNSKSSLELTNRTNPGTGLKHPMMLGAANYLITLYAMQTSVTSTSHALHLLGVYTCLGDSAIHSDEIAIQYGTTVWTPLTGVMAFPPHDAPQGCKLTSASLWVTQADVGTATACGTGAGQIECPDIFVDDVSIILTNRTSLL